MYAQRNVSYCSKISPMEWRFPTRVVYKLSCRRKCGQAIIVRPTALLAISVLSVCNKISIVDSEKPEPS